MRVCSCACMRIDPVANSSSFGSKLHAGATAGRSCRRRRSSRLHPSRVYLHSGHVALLPGVKVQPPPPPLSSSSSSWKDKLRHGKKSVLLSFARQTRVYVNAFHMEQLFFLPWPRAQHYENRSHQILQLTVISTASPQTWRCSGHISDKRQIGLYMEDAVQNLNEN